MEKQQLMRAVGLGAAAIAAGAAVYALTSGCACKKQITSARTYSVLLPAEAEGESVILRNAMSPEALVKTFDPSVLTLYDAFRRGLRLSPDGPCYGARAPEGGPYVWKTYRDVEAMSQHVGGALSGLGITAGDPIGIFAVNRMEWGYLMLASAAYSLTLVSLYDTLGADSSQYILNKCSIEVLFVTDETLPRIEEELGNVPKLRLLVNMDAPDDYDTEINGIRRMSFARLVALGKAEPHAPVPPTPDTLATILFTSGTTGLPKGVMSTHGQVIAELSSVLMQLSSVVRKEDVHFSYLPLAHSFERIVQYALLAQGGSIGFFRGDIKKHFMSDVAELRPTVFCSVPRLFNRLYDASMAKLGALTGLQKMMFDYAWAAKRANLEQGKLTHWLWDRLLFSKVAAALGGRVNVMLSGSAPITPEVLEFLRICFSCQVLEGYGQTECVGGCCVTMPGDFQAGNVGPPLLCNEVKVVDVPEMNYSSASNPPCGELCIRGNNVMSGYFEDEERTREAMPDGEWLHTGDIACLLPNGTVRLIDRVKSIFKLSQGEYIAPEKVENYYVKSKYIMQAYVHGDSTRDEIVAVIVIDPATVLPWAEQNGLSQDMAVLLESGELRKLITSELAAAAERYKLNRLETARKFHLTDEEFTVGSGMLTPSFKLVRRVALEHFREKFDDLYSSS